MPKDTDITIPAQKRFAGGISDYLKESANGQIADAFFYSRAVNFRDDPQAVTLLPSSIKETASLITDFVKWADLVPISLSSYYYGDTGNLYQRTSGAVWSLIGQEPGSHGNGLAYFAGDDYVYMTSDKTLGRYGPTQSSPTLATDFLTAQGGVPQNTASLATASASSMYATAASSNSLKITSDITLEAFFKATTLPAVGSSMTLLGKWDESSTTRGYKMDIYGISGFFGSGTDGSLTISSNTTEAPIDSACTGSAGSQALTATNSSFAVGQVVLIHQSQGTNAGQWERNTIGGYTAGTITLGTPLIGTYTTGAQVRNLPQYTGVTINSGITYTAKAWNGTVGGILAFLCSGTTTVTGNIVADGCGYRGAPGGSSQQQTGKRGEGTLGNDLARTTANQGNGGGGGQGGAVDGSGPTGGGGGGGNSVAGTNGVGYNGGTGGRGGNAVGSADATTAIFGGGGGEDGTRNNTDTIGCTSGSGGGIVFISGVTITVTGTISSNGKGPVLSGGSGAAGVVLLKAQTLTLGTSLVTATGIVSSYGGSGNGYCVTNYLTSYTGTTTPTLNAINDQSLVTTASWQARIGISNDGTAFEYLSILVPSLTTGVWNRLSIAWKASTSTAQFYQNATLLGTAVGTKTAISSNAALLYVAANKTASAAANFLNGLIDDVRIWNTVQTAAQIYQNNTVELNGNEAGLAAYWTLDSVATDKTSNANTLTLVNSPTYSTDVPFLFATTRLDIDQQYTTNGQTYTLPTALAETSTAKLTFTPALDPQKSMAFNINAKGTGDWTLTIHNMQNQVIATVTVTNANLPASGWYEFVFSTPWRVVPGRTYHAHLVSTVNDGSVVTSTTSDFSTGDFYTYYQFLVTDTQFHPMMPFLNFLAIGNERYIAKWDGAFYTANAVVFPPSWHVRCFGFWREYLTVGMWRGGNIYDFDKGRVYFWDGIAPTFNFFIDVPEGQINALFGIDSDLYMFAGFKGQLLDYKGGYLYNTGNSSSNKLKRMPQIATTDYTEVFPGALTMWRGLLHFGLFANSNTTTVSRGVYSYGTLNQYYPDTLSYDYVISTGNTGNSVSIGCVFPLGQSLMVGWKDGISFGVDKVNFTNPPASSGEIQMLASDGGSLWHTSAQFQARADYLPLNSGESIQTKVKLARATTFTTGTLDTVAGSTFSKVQLPTGRANEWQVGVNLFSSGSTSPTLLSLAIQQNPLSSEERF